MDRSSDFVSIAFLGEARKEKGYQYLYHFVTQWLKYSQYPTKFIIHSFANEVNDIDLIRHNREKLVQLQKIYPHNIHIYNVPLSSTLYDSHLTNSDAILLPYELNKYKIRGSGVAFEAFWHHCVLIATQNTDISFTFNSKANYQINPENITEKDVDTIITKILDNRSQMSQLNQHNSLEHYHFNYMISQIFQSISASANNEQFSDLEELLSLLKSRDEPTLLGIARRIEL